MIVIQHSDGSTQDGVLLSLQGDTLRIAGKGSDDVLEFRLIHHSWVSEDCEIVTFSFPLAIFEAIGIVPGDRNEPVGTLVPEYRAAAACGQVN
jgi:hypothetical protein